MTSGEDDILFTPFQLGPYRLANRLVLSPMTRHRCPGEVPGTMNMEYYAQRADAGLVICESTAISPRGIAFLDSPSIYDEKHVRGWRQVVDAIHRRGAAAFLQLFHGGRISHPEMQRDGGQPIGPSAVPIDDMLRTPSGRQPIPLCRALETEEIPGLVEEFVSAARNAWAAGFDGVEVHAANGYLLDQFLRDCTNRRSDSYGGPPENRARLLFEVVDAIIEAGGTRRVGVRLSPTNPHRQMSDSDPQRLFEHVLTGLDSRGLAYVHMVEGSTNEVPEAGSVDYMALRRLFGGPYIANNKYTRERATEAIRSGHADLVAFGRSYIANPDLVSRLRTGAALAEIDRSTLHAQGPAGYVDYPEMAAKGSEKTDRGA